jgi:fucose permease
MAMTLLVPLLCYAFITYYSFIGSKVLFPRCNMVPYLQKLP